MPFGIGFHFAVEKVELIEPMAFFFRLGSAAVDISEYNGGLYYTAPGIS